MRVQLNLPRRNCTPGLVAGLLLRLSAPGKAAAADRAATKFENYHEENGRIEVTTIGFLAGGPVGAIIGGFAGAVIGAEAGIATSTIEYAGNNPVEPVIIQGSLDVGAAVPAGVTIYPVEGDPTYGYFYANGRVWIVELASNTLVYSPGFVVSQSAADFAIANPIDPVTVEGDVVVGYALPDGTTITPIPEDPYYGYVYIDGRAALVDNSTRTIVWVN